MVSAGRPRVPPWPCAPGLVRCVRAGRGLAGPRRFPRLQRDAEHVGVGIGYRAKAGWITEGWWHIEGSSCKTLIEGPLSSRFYYLYAEDAERGGRWDGPINCAWPKKVQVAGVTDCVAGASSAPDSRNMTRANRQAGWSS